MIPTTHQNCFSVLLIEDDCDDQDFITEALLRVDNRLSIYTVANGKKALFYLQCLPDAQLPQLVILDYNLPELDCIEVLQLLQQTNRYQAIPKIVWSTSNAPQYKQRSLASGAALYMVKPSTIDGIEQMARHMLELCHTDA